MVRRSVASGRYATPEAFVEDALASWSKQVTDRSGPMIAEVPSRQSYVQERNQAVREAQEELGRGEYRDLDAGGLDALLDGVLPPTNDGPLW